MCVVVMLDHFGLVEIVEGAALEGLRREGEARRMDDVDRNAEAGAEPEQGAGVLRDVRLIEGELTGMARSFSQRPERGCGYSVASRFRPVFPAGQVPWGVQKDQPNHAVVE